MRMEVTVEIQRDTWVRNHEANVEIYTDYPLRVNVEGQQLDLTGVLATDRGDYTFLGKRFAITRGSAMFIGARPRFRPVGVSELGRQNSSRCPPRSPVRRHSAAPRPCGGRCGAGSAAT